MSSTPVSLTSPKIHIEEVTPTVPNRDFSFKMLALRHLLNRLIDSSVDQQVSPEDFTRLFKSYGYADQLAMSSAACIVLGLMEVDDKAHYNEFLAKEESDA